MHQWSHFTQQIVETLAHVPATECGRLLAYALAIKYNVVASKSADHGTAREIAMTLFQVPEEDLFAVVAQAYALSLHHSDDNHPGENHPQENSPAAEDFSDFADFD